LVFPTDDGSPKDVDVLLVDDKKDETYEQEFKLSYEVVNATNPSFIGLALNGHRTATGLIRDNDGEFLLFGPIILLSCSNQCKIKQHQSGYQYFLWQVLCKLGKG